MIGKQFENNDISAFQHAVYNACSRIPSGYVATYRDVAIAIGRPGAVRAVGNALNKNPFAPTVPCHRVVRSDGRVGGFASGSVRKTALLQKEGVCVQNGRVQMFEDRRYRFKS
jgi:O-6-methylguanine DNA methyltransferase